MTEVIVTARWTDAARPGAPRCARRASSSGAVLTAIIVLAALVSFVWTPVRLRRAGHPEQAPGSELEPLVRDRSVRSRHPVDDPRRRPHLDRGGARRGRDRHRRRDAARARRGRPARHAARRDHHARQRPGLRVSGAAHRHPDHRGVRAGRDQRHHRHRHLQHSGVRTTEPGRGAEPLAARVHPRGARRRERARPASRSSTSCPTSSTR